MSTKGFSIIELMVAIGIIAIVSVLVFPGYGIFNRNIFLEEEVNNIAKEIERVRGMSISAKEVDFEIDENLYDFVPGRRYGIRFESDNYELFAETRIVPTGGGDEEIRRVIIRKKELEREVVVFSPEDPLEVTFSPPDPTVRFSEEEVDEVEIEIGYAYENDPKMIIIVNSVGLVSIKHL